MVKARELGVTTAPSGSWVQVERAALERWSRLGMENPRAASVMMTLVHHMGRNNAVVVSQKTLAELCSCSRATLQRALDILRSGNWIDVRQIGPTGTANAYIVNRRVAWSGARAGQRYALFDAAVVVSATEQPDAETLDDLPPLESIPAMFKGERQLPTGPGMPPPSQPSLDGLEADLPATSRDDPAQ